MQEMRVQPLSQEDPPEEEMTTHPVLLPGESHGQRSPAESMGSQRIEHKWASMQQQQLIAHLNMVKKNFMLCGVLLYVMCFDHN